MHQKEDVMRANHSFSTAHASAYIHTHTFIHTGTSRLHFTCPNQTLTPYVGLQIFDLKVHRRTDYFHNKNPLKHIRTKADFAMQSINEIKKSIWFLRTAGLQRQHVQMCVFLYSVWAVVSVSCFLLKRFQERLTKTQRVYFWPWRDRKKDEVIRFKKEMQLSKNIQWKEKGQRRKKTTSQS